MSMLMIGFKWKGETGVVYAGSLGGVLDFKKRNEHWAREHRESADDTENEHQFEYHRKRADEYQEAALGGEALSGTEHEAREHGFWRVDSEEAKDAWVQRKTETQGVNYVSPEKCPLFIDFDEEHLVLDPRTMLVDYDLFVPDGWTTEVREIPGSQKWVH